MSFFWDCLCFIRHKEDMWPQSQPKKCIVLPEHLNMAFLWTYCVVDILWTLHKQTLCSIFISLQLASLSPPMSYWCRPLLSPLNYQVWLTAILLLWLFCHLSCSAMPAGWLHSTIACGDNNLHWSDPSAYPAVTNGNWLLCGSAINCPTFICVYGTGCVWSCASVAVPRASLALTH